MTHLELGPTFHCRRSEEYQDIIANIRLLAILGESPFPHLHMLSGARAAQCRVRGCAFNRTYTPFSFGCSLQQRAMRRQMGPKTALDRQSRSCRKRVPKADDAGVFSRQCDCGVNCVGSAFGNRELTLREPRVRAAAARVRSRSRGLAPRASSLGAACADALQGRAVGGSARGAHGRSRSAQRRGETPASVVAHPSKKKKSGGSRLKCLVLSSRARALSV